MSSDSSDVATSNIRDLWAALRLIREELEQHVLVPPEIPEPEPLKEAEMLVQAVAALVEEYDSKISDMEQDVSNAASQAWHDKQDAKRAVQRAKHDAEEARTLLSIREAEHRRQEQKRESDVAWNRLLRRPGYR